MSMNRLQQLKRLESDLKNDPRLLQQLFADPKGVVERLEYLDHDLRYNLGNISLFEVLTGMTGVLNGLNACGERSCGQSSTCAGTTCSDTCTGTTCGEGTCSDTCGQIKSCSDTCQGSTCSGGCTMSDPSTSSLGPENWGQHDILEPLILYAEHLKGIDPYEIRFARYYR